jgi:hypothetical protein
MKKKKIKGRNLLAVDAHFRHGGPMDDKKKKKKVKHKNQEIEFDSTQSPECYPSY